MVNENVAAIMAVPSSILPQAPRAFLVELAASGSDTYAYAPMQLEADPERQRWNIWHDGCRYPLAEWLAAFYRPRRLAEGITDTADAGE